MPLPPGTRLGRYAILELRGKGGMGEVYRARDTRLDRDVAVKVLPAELSADASFRHRFEREARAISQLQHPHVCTLHDVGSHDGVDYLVMEYLEGGTLADRLAGGALPLEEAVRIGGEIAEAIDAAHRRGIVHRDLKPGNVMLSRSGTKVVDFGLAKGFAQVGPGAETQMPTRTQPATAEGSLVGTLVYMSPEQLEGREADARSDIWALGCVLYEMVTGERPFAGASNASLIGSILREEPEPPSRKRPLLPRRLDWIVGRCLEKDPERRWQSARDVAIELDAIAKGDEVATVAEPAPAPRRLPWVAWLATVLATAAVTGLVVSRLDSSRREAPGAGAAAGSSELRLRQLTARPPDDTVHTAALSPDGEQLAFATQAGLFLQIVETGQERLVPLPAELQVLEVDWLGPTQLLFSASTGDAFGLYKTSIFGGATRRLTGGAWRAAVSADGSRIAYLEGVPSRTVIVAGPDGENPRAVLDLEGRGAVWEIAWSPDGRWLLAGIWGGSINPLDTILEAIDVETGSRQEVLADPRFFQDWRGFLPFLWTADDLLVLGRSELEPNRLTGNLWRVPIDPSTAAILGDPERLTQLTGTNPKDLSATTDGRRLAFLQERSQNDVLVAALAEGGRALAGVRRLTVDERADGPVAWSREGDAIFFQSSRTGTWAYFRTPLDRDGVEFVSNAGLGSQFFEIARDGESILFFRGSKLVRVPLGGGPVETLLEAREWPGIGCDAAGQRCLVGERLPEGPTYVFYDFDVEAGRGEEVLRIDDYPPFTNWDVSPDGSRLVVGHNDDRLRLFDLATGEETVLTYEGLSYGEFPAWSADGRGIFVDGGYATRGRLRKGLLRVSLADGEVRVLRDNWNEWNTHPVPSRDGRQLAFAANFFYDGNAWMIEDF